MYKMWNENQKRMTLRRCGLRTKTWQQSIKRRGTLDLMITTCVCKYVPQRGKQGVKFFCYALPFYTFLLNGSSSLCSPTPQTKENSLSEKCQWCAPARSVCRQAGGREGKAAALFSNLCRPAERLDLYEHIISWGYPTIYHLHTIIHHQHFKKVEFRKKRLESHVELDIVLLNKSTEHTQGKDKVSTSGDIWWRERQEREKKEVFWEQKHRPNCRRSNVDPSFLCLACWFDKSVYPAGCCLSFQVRFCPVGMMMIVHTTSCMLPGLNSTLCCCYYLMMMHTGSVERGRVRSQVVEIQFIIIHHHHFKHPFPAPTLALNGNESPCWRKGSPSITKWRSFG